MKNQYLKHGLFGNKYLLGAFALGTLMQIIVVIIPAIAEVFKLVPLNSTQWIYTIAISVIPIIVMEVQKKINEMRFGKVIYEKSVNNA